jgi:hypothetical protein
MVSRADGLIADRWCWIDVLEVWSSAAPTTDVQQIALAPSYQPSACQRRSSGSACFSEIGRWRWSNIPLPGAEPSRLGAVAAGCHVAPAASPVARRVVEDARATSVSASTHAQELTAYQRFGRRLDDWNHETGERVSDRHEALLERAIVTKLHTAVTGASTEHAIDLDECVGACLFEDGATFGKRAQGGANSTRIDKGGGGTGRLLFGASRDANCSLGVKHAGGTQPLNQGVEIAKHIDTDATPQVVRIHEVQPEPLADENEGRRRNDHLGVYRTGGGLRGDKSHWRQAYVATLSTASEMNSRGSRSSSGDASHVIDHS